MPKPSIEWASPVFREPVHLNPAGVNHRPGCICGMSFFAPELPERQAEMRSRMLAAEKESEQAKRQRRINELCTDSGWRAALLILTCPHLSRDGRVWRHVDLDRGLIHFKAMLRDYTFSGGERRLVEIAASLFNGEHKVSLSHVMSGLDYIGTEAVHAAIKAYMRIH